MSHMDDKQLHYDAGAVTQSYVEMQTGSRLYGCMSAVAIGVAKETYDSLGNGTVDVHDVSATAAGCSVTYRF